MIMSATVLVFLAALLTVGAQLNTVFILRHCDKVTDSNPCCSQQGYDRANTWHKVLDPFMAGTGKKMHTYSASANYDTLCKPNLVYAKNKNCQGSQRMAITSSLINYNLEVEATLSTDYCIGEYVRLVQDINTGAHGFNLVVWKHGEIPSMINEWGVPLKSWPSSLDWLYSIIFKLSFATPTPTLTYNCYDFVSNSINCTDEVKTWMKGYGTFELPTGL